jgi:hypothetical protein
LQDTLNQIQQRDSIQTESGNAIPFDLSPNTIIKDGYWFEEFVSDVLVSTSDYLESRTFFEGKTFEENSFTNKSPWLVIILIICFSLIAFIRGFHRKRLKLISKAFINWKFGKQIVRYEKVYTHPVNIALVLNFHISTSLFFSFLIFDFIEPSVPPLKLLGISMLAIFIYSIAKLIIYKFTAWTLESKELVNEYVFHVNLINKFLGLIFLVLCLFLSFSKVPYEPIYWVGISAIIISIGIQTIRGVFIGRQKSNDLIFIILYLCTLEILPLLIMVKLILNEL